MVNCKEVKGFVDVRDRCKHAYVVSVIFSFVPGFLNVFSSDAELFNILFGYFDQSQVLTSPVTNYVVDVLNGVLREQPVRHATGYYFLSPFFFGSYPLFRIDLDGFDCLSCRISMGLSVFI